MKKILAISGGGMRGVIASTILGFIDNLFPSIQWDCVFGTSTGAVLAALLTKPGTPLTPSQILNWYYTEGPKIFSSGWLNRNLFFPKYGSKALYQSLQRCIGGHKMSACRPQFIAATVDADNILPIWLSGDSDWFAWEAAAASSSAQTYFPSFKKDGTRYIDGGNFSNNPSRHAANFGERNWPGEPVLVVHLGTGIAATATPLPEGGLVQWAPKIFGEMDQLQCIESNRDAALMQENFFDFNVSLRSISSMDDASISVLDGYVSETKATLNRIPESTWVNLGKFLS